MRALGRWFLTHWFGGVLALVLILWASTVVAYRLGAEGVSFGNRYTPTRPATLDFRRDRDAPVVWLGEGVGLELSAGGGTVRGTVVRLAASPWGLCWVCGEYVLDGGIAMVAYRNGDWLYREPRDLTRSNAATRSRGVEARDFIQTLAYNLVTGERVIVDARAGIEAQQRELTARGLVVADTNRLGPETLAELSSVSMMYEGCAIVNAAFIIVVLLWTVLAGAWALFARRRSSRARRRPPPA
jgi:hypothetical protein